MMDKEPRKKRKSRARFPPITPEERSAINAANATKNGLYSAERKLTQELIESLLAYYGGKSRRDAPPHRGIEAEVCPQWRSDAVAMADYVIEHHGFRVSRNQKLRRVDDALPWAPGNVKGWEYTAPQPRRRAKRAARLLQTVTPDCLCDHRAQAACARLPRPCDWAAATRGEPSWEPPAD